MAKRKMSVEDLVKKFIQVHGSKYDYSKVKYEFGYRKVTINCPIHGDFEQRISGHLEGKGCKCCADNRRKTTLEGFIKKSAEIHGDVYDYSEFKYKGSHYKGKIICPIHGGFKQTPSNHLAGSKCPECMSSLRSYRFSHWQAQCPGNPGIFYILRCWNDEEEFFKVGITCQESVSVRYTGKQAMPYNFEVIKEVVDYEREKIWNMEKASITYSKEYHYIPDISFGGSLKECFTKVLIDINI